MNMRISKLWLLIALVLVIPALTSCNDDDDDKTADYATKISGEYDGTITVPAMAAFGIPAQTIPDIDIDITRSGTNSAVLKMDETLPIVGQQIPLDVSCPVVASDAGSGKTKITGNTTVTLKTPIVIVGQSYTQLPVSISGTIDSSNKASIDITVLSLITVNFAGVKE